MPPDHLALHVLKLHLQMVGPLNAGHAGKDGDAEDGRKTHGDDLMRRRQEHVFFCKDILKSLPANREGFAGGGRRFSFHGWSSCLAVSSKSSYGFTQE